jgi:TPR repeat protein
VRRIIRGQAYLGMAYNEGIGVPQSPIEAHKWLNLAVARMADGDKLKNPAIVWRDKIQNQMTSAELDEARKDVTNWVAKSERSTNSRKRMYSICFD